VPSETNLDRLLSLMSPALQEDEYVFCCVEDRPFVEFDALSILGVFREAEGLTLILPREAAEQAGYAFGGIFRCITLEVDSSLHAVGLTAAISSALAKEGIAANVVAACYHDHVFVPAEKAVTALATLQQLSV